MKTARIPLRKSSPSSIMLNVILLGFVLLTIVGFFFLDSKKADVAAASLKALNDLRTMLFEPVMEHLNWTEAFTQLGVTLGLSFLTTLFGAIIALFLSFFAARNLGNVVLGNILKTFVAVVRAVPTVLWVLIFAIGAGLGAVAAVVGMSFHTVGYLLKAYSESFEEIDGGVIEALKAGGARWWHIVFQAVLPATLTALLSWTFIRFEINFTTAVAMGAAAGAGGIGFDLFMASSFYFNIREVGFLTWLILLTALVMEIIATRLRETNKLHG